MVNDGSSPAFLCALLRHARGLTNHLPGSAAFTEVLDAPVEEVAESFAQGDDRGDALGVRSPVVERGVVQVESDLRELSSGVRRHTSTIVDEREACQ